MFAILVMFALLVSSYYGIVVRELCRIRQYASSTEYEGAAEYDSAAE